LTHGWLSARWLDNTLTGFYEGRDTALPLAKFIVTRAVKPQ
jgi:hypothetical protein